MSVHIVDVGSSPIDGPAPYQRMLEAGWCRVTAFEPQEQWRQGARPEVIYDGTDRVLHLTAAPGMASLLEPDMDALRSLPGFVELGALVRKQSVPTVTLDRAVVEDVDFLKMDVQGAELTIMKNAPRIMQEIVGLQIEVSFMPLYKGQSVFGEVDLWLREQGFIPHAFADIKGWPLIAGLRSPAHQLLEADVIYVRDFRQAHGLSAGKWRALADLAMHYFGSPDLASVAATNAEAMLRTAA